MKTKKYYESKRKSIRITLGLIIRKNRKLANITQEELAGVLGVTKGSISRYESGKTELAASALPIISEVCGFSLKEYIKPIAADEAMKKMEKMLWCRKADYDMVCEDGISYGQPEEELLREEAVQDLGSMDNGETVSFINNVSEVVTYMQKNHVDYVVRNDLIDLTIECVSKKAADKKEMSRLEAYLKMLRKA